jgi:hypothetical protein
MESLEYGDSAATWVAYNNRDGAPTFDKYRFYDNNEYKSTCSVKDCNEAGGNLNIKL